MNILILHGWGQTSLLFEPLKSQLETLPSVEKVVTLDLPGFGTQKAANLNWDIPEYSDWVKAQIEALKLKKVLIIGHSFGGRIAAYLAAQKPREIQALILSGSPLLYRPAKKTKIKNTVSKLIKKITPHTIKSVLYSKDLAEAEAMGMGNVFRKAVVFDQTNSLPNIDVPTLLLWGENDSDAPLYIANESERLIPHSKLEIIPKAGHNSFHSHPYIFFSHVKKFIESI